MTQPPSDHPFADLKESPPRLGLMTDGFGTTLCCPVCGFNYVHPAGVEVEQGNLRTSIGCNQVSATGVAEFAARGSRIHLSFWCEIGLHLFVYTLTFHKGNTIVGLRTGRGKDVEALPELWRD